MKSEQNDPAVLGPVERQVRPGAEAHAAPAVLDTDDIEVLREELAVAWGDLMTAQLRSNDQAAQLGPLEALRFFCSQHLPAQTWLESEPLFNAVAAKLEQCAAEIERLQAEFERKLLAAHMD